jgi:hypothetical protein
MKIIPLNGEDENGNSYQLLAYYNEKKVETRGCPNDVMLIRSHITTENGQNVNFIGPGKYEIVGTGIILTADDSKLP